MKRLLVLVLLFLCCRVATAQTTTVVGTVTDPNGNPYYPGTVAAALQFPSGTNPNVNPSSGPFPTTTGGNFSIALPSNTAITPPGTVWIITLCAKTVPIPNVGQTQVCFSSPPLSITGVSRDISSIMQPIAPILGPSGGNGTGTNLLPSNNNWTGINNFNNLTQFNGDVYFKSGAPWYDVRAFGCAGDGATDDTNCILSAANQALADLTAAGHGGGGTIYFPNSSGCYKFSTLHLPSSNQGWLVYLFDNGLCGNTIFPGSNNAFIGRSGSFQGLSGTFLYGNNTTWVQSSVQSSPLVDIAATTQVWFEGINFEGNSTAETIHSHDIAGSGSTWETFYKCVVDNISSGSDYLADSSSSSTPSGFGFRSMFSSWQGPNTLTFINFKSINFEHSFVGGGTITVTNLGIASDGDVSFNDIESEGLDGEDFLVATGTFVNDFWFKDISISDQTSPVYIFKNLTTGGPTGPVHFEPIVHGFGDGLMDPAGSYPLVFCEGAPEATGNVGCPPWIDTLQQLSPGSPPPDPGPSQDRTWWDTSDNWRCITHGGSQCGMVVGNFLASFITNAAWSTSSELCTDTSSPPRAVTSGCSPGVANFTPVPYVHVNGASSGTLQNIAEGQGAGGSNNSNTSYTYKDTDRFMVVTRGITAATTDTIPQAGTGYSGACSNVASGTTSLGFNCNYTTNIINSGTAVLSVSTTGSAWTCPGYPEFCTSGAGGTLTLYPGFRATVYTPDESGWTAVIIPNPPGVLADIQKNGTSLTPVSGVAFFTAPVTGMYRFTFAIGCIGGTSITFSAGSWTDPYSGQSDSFSTIGTCGSSTAGSIVYAITAGTVLTYSTSHVSTQTTYGYSILVEGPF